VTRRRRQNRPSLDSIKIKIDRARLHLDCLQVEYGRRFPTGLQLACEIKPNGLRHVYRADHPPTVDPVWSAVIGDCVHNLRSALDHIAYQLVRSPNTRTQFPILDRPPRTRWRRKRVVPQVSGGASLLVRGVIEAVQPYNRRDLHHGLAAVRDLDNIDKHRELLLLATATGSHVTSWWEGSPDAPPPHTTRFTRKPLVHDQVMAVVTYQRPYRQADPYLRFVPHLAFERGGPLAGDAILLVLTDLMVLVQDEILPLFEPFFSDAPRRPA
jgi:hypothetical protein